MRTRKRTPKVSVRAWTAEDIPGIVVCHRAAYSEYPKNAYYTERFYEMQFAAFSEGQYLAEIDGVIVGYATSLIVQLDDDAHWYTYEEITGGVEHMKVGGREVHGRAYVASFNFKGSDQQKLVGDLSGGERNRVHLAKLLKRGGNLLLLDEPTNDLDVDTLRALEDALEQFPGCAVVISHDRWFLDRIATHVLAFEGNSQVRWFEGNFQDYEAWRRKELGVDAEQPKRLRYKPLVRK